MPQDLVNIEKKRKSLTTEPGFQFKPSQWLSNCQAKTKKARHEDLCPQTGGLALGGLRGGACWTHSDALVSF